MSQVRKSAYVIMIQTYVITGQTGDVLAFLDNHHPFLPFPDVEQQ